MFHLTKLLTNLITEIVFENILGRISEFKFSVSLIESTTKSTLHCKL